MSIAHVRTSHKSVVPAADISLQQRLTKALEEQKRKRAQRVASSRDLDAISSLSLGPNDDSDSELDLVKEGISSFARLLPKPTAITTAIEASARNRKSKESKSFKNAQKCMYAELLELGQGPAELGSLPPDLQTNWIALAPVPKGKRCLLVTNKMNGNPSSVPTTLHSRLKGKTILTFPSLLPPNTILDCILDNQWSGNGVLHILDVVRWHGREIGDSECAFRFWWRDTRISEIDPLPSSRMPSTSTSSGYEYPIYFLVVPSFSPLPFSYLLSTVIPSASSSRSVSMKCCAQSTDHGMELDGPELIHIRNFESDGLLLYHSFASYESGTSPLSLWIPLNDNSGSRNYLLEFHSAITKCQRGDSSAREGTAQAEAVANEIDMQ